MKTLKCQYCGEATVKVQGDVIYKGRPDLKDKNFFLCVDCNAYVGCHKNGSPLGTVANENLRKMRSSAHRIFDEIWKMNYMSRNSAYKMLAEKLKISKARCHIAMFDEEMCLKVLKISNEFFTDSKKINI